MLLDEINDVLRKHNVRNWTDVLLDIANQIEQAKNLNDPSHILAFIEEIKGLYSGMGSFNDIFITDQAGHDISPEDIDIVNSRLQTLQTELYLEVKNTEAQLKSDNKS